MYVDTIDKVCTHNIVRLYTAYDTTTLYEEPSCELDRVASTVWYCCSALAVSKSKGRPDFLRINK